MKMDLDVEAMLEAPFKKKKIEQAMNGGHRRHSSLEERSRYNSRERPPARSRDFRSEHRSHYRNPSPERRPTHSRSHRNNGYTSDRLHGTRERYGHRSRSSRRIRTPELHSHRHQGRGPSYSPPLLPPDRDKRTVFVTQLAQRLKTRELEEFFSQAGRVRSSGISTDRHTGRSKGVGYIEFYDESTVKHALALSGQQLLGIPINVQLTDTTKTRLALEAKQNRNQTPDTPIAKSMLIAQTLAVNDVMDQRLYVGSVNYNLTDYDLRQVFEPYGPIDFVDLHKDPATGQSKGFAFIQFKNVKDAKEALLNMNGFELAGRNLKVGMVTVKSQQPNKQNASDNDSDSLDDDSMGITLNSMSRTELMKKLAARETDLTPPAVPYRTILLSNMFDPAEETEPDWVDELTMDIKEECERNYGVVEHIHANPDSMGEVSLKFDTIESGEIAIHALNGRWFGGRQIQAAFVPENEYDRRFS